MFLAEEIGLRRRVDAALDNQPDDAKQPVSDRIRSVLEKLENHLATPDQAKLNMLSFWVDVVDADEGVSYKVDRIHTNVGISGCTVSYLNLKQAGSMVSNHYYLVTSESGDNYMTYLRTNDRARQLHGNDAAEQMLEALEDVVFCINTQDDRPDAQTKAQVVIPGSLGV